MSIEVRPVAEPVLELVGGQEARAGVARLGAEHAVELGRVAARLVDLEVQLRRVEHDREPSGRALRRAEQRDCLLGHRLGALLHAETPDVLVAGGLPAAASIRVAPALVFVTVDRVGLDRGADVGDRLLGEAPVARGERLPFALRAVDGLGEDDARHGRRSLIGGEQVRDLRVERDRERVLLDGRFERAVGRRPIVEHHRGAQGGGRCTRDPDGFAGDAIRLRGRQDVRARKAPRAVDQHPDAETFVLAGGDAFDAAGLDRDGLAEPSDDARVGVPRTERHGRVEGTVGDFPHWGRA